MKSLCVFCGSSLGNHSSFESAAEKLGARIADEGIRLVYGGGSVGLMGVLANSVLAKGGEVVGVIPEFLATRELLHTGVTELRLVPSMHERKALMSDLSDAFIALPGGFGTLEELFEVLTWAQLGLHRKPIGILNWEGFFNSLLGYLHSVVDAGFIRETERNILTVEDDPGALLTILKSLTTSQMNFPIDRSEI